MKNRCLFDAIFFDCQTGSATHAVRLWDRQERHLYRRSDIMLVWSGLADQSEKINKGTASLGVLCYSFFLSFLQTLCGHAMIRPRGLHRV
ncbi:hypothetical protein BCR43DRAFT_493383, partial [Syncephalastrum racemosum]